jgi:Ca2+:H+ antiporter
LLSLKLFVSALSPVTSRTAILQGIEHLVLFVLFLFTTLVP